jgi:hypothetical protein
VVTSSVAVTFDDDLRYRIARADAGHVPAEATAEPSALVAPAGYGKTVLARQWADTVPGFQPWRDVTLELAGFAGSWYFIWATRSFRNMSFWLPWSLRSHRLLSLS